MFFILWTFITNYFPQKQFGNWKFPETYKFSNYFQRHFDVQKMSEHRLRLVVFGDSYVGKSAIVKKFLTGKFDDTYVATVEDLYGRDFEIGNASIKVDILDTAGDAQFPAMRR